MKVLRSTEGKPKEECLASELKLLERLESIGFQNRVRRETATNCSTK